MPRMNILNAEERNAFDCPPVLSSADRKRVFARSAKVDSVLRTLRTPTNEIYFLLMLGYFKATSRFFLRTQFNEADLSYVARSLGYFEFIAPATELDEATYRRYRKLVLDHLGVRTFDSHSRDELLAHIRPMVRSQARPKAILLSTLDFLERRKTEAPNLFTLSEMILGEMRLHKEALARVIQQALTPATRELLEALLEPESSSKPNLKVQRARITLLKRISQSTKVSKIKLSVDDMMTLREMYVPLRPVLESLDLSREGIRYYANSVIKSEVFQIGRRTNEDRRLHLVCFIAHQYLRSQETLVDILLQVVQKSLNTIKSEHKEQHYEQRVEQKRTVKAFAESVHAHALDPLAEIEAVAFADELPAIDKVKRIKSILSNKSQERKSVADEVAHIEAQPEPSHEDDAWFTILETRSKKLQNRASEIVKSVEFQGDSALLEAIAHLRDKSGTVGQEPPLGFLPPTEQEHLVDANGRLRVSLYKALLFVKVVEAIKSGELNVADTYKYRPLDTYLLCSKKWQQNRERLLEQAELTDYSSAADTIDSLAKQLDQEYRTTNGHVLTEQNEHVSFRKDGSWFVATPGAEDETDEPFAGVFRENRYISLLEILSTTNRATKFSEDFQHSQQKYNRAKPPDRTFFAGIIGYGCNIGTKKIARISTQVTESEVENAINWYFSLGNLYAANDRILGFLDRMELPNAFRESTETLHTSSDGQKFGVTVDSLNANHSFKYFGHGRGVSVCTFIDERNFLFHSTVVSSAEKEAAYVIDGLMHNDVVKSDVHSTDTHGYTDVVFGVMHLLGFSFAPRIKNVGKATLHSVTHKRSEYEAEDFKILPKGYINTALIEEQWEDILRFVATIKLKVTTASQLFRRLNSYAKLHPLYRALKEFGKIVKSIFILRYADQLEMRQVIQKILNKGEHANRFSKAVGFGNNQAFAQGEKSEQEIAETCRRLIKNSIICWNYLYASKRLLEETDKERQQELLTAIRGGSMVAWRHINLHGEYDFSDENLRDSVGLDVPKIQRLELN